MTIFSLLYFGVVLIYVVAIYLAIKLWVIRFTEFADARGTVKRFRKSRTERAFFVVVFGTFASLLMINALLPYLMYEGGNTTANEGRFTIAHYAKAIFVAGVHYAALLDVRSFIRDYHEGNRLCRS